MLFECWEFWKKLYLVHRFLKSIFKLNVNPILPVLWGYQYQVRKTTFYYSCHTRKPAHISVTNDIFTKEAELFPPTTIPPPLLPPPLLLVLQKFNNHDHTIQVLENLTLDYQCYSHLCHISFSIFHIRHKTHGWACLMDIHCFQPSLGSSLLQIVSYKI